MKLLCQNGESVVVDSIKKIFYLLPLEGEPPVGIKDKSTTNLEEGRIKGGG